MLHGFKIKKCDSLEGNKIIVAVGISQGSKTINRPPPSLISEPPLTDWYNSEWIKFWRVVCCGNLRFTVKPFTYKKTLYCPLQFSNKLSDKKINLSWQSSTERKLTWATTFGVRDWILARNRSWARFEASFRSRRSRSSEVSGGNSVRWLSSSLWSF